VLHIAAGYADANDSHTRRDAPICKLRLDRRPATGASLASHPTLARFAHRVSRPALSRLALALLHPCIASSARAPKVSVLEVDDTEAPVHGGQEHARYDGYDGGDCFMPRPGYEGLSGRLSTTLLQAKRFPGAPRLAVLQRLGKRLRQVWPHPRWIVRGESHCADPEVMPWIAAPPSMGSVTGLTSHAVLQALAQEGVEQATRA
jgi:DDE family transposase